jgi:hypothetical protein
LEKYFHYAPSRVTIALPSNKHCGESFSSFFNSGIEKYQLSSDKWEHVLLENKVIQMGCWNVYKQVFNQ